MHKMDSCLRRNDYPRLNLMAVHPGEDKLRQEFNANRNGFLRIWE